MHQASQSSCHLWHNLLPVLFGGVHFFCRVKVLATL